MKTVLVRYCQEDIAVHILGTPNDRRLSTGGRKGEEDPGGSSMEGGSRGGESHLVGDIIRNVKYTAVKVHTTI